MWQYQWHFHCIRASAWRFCKTPFCRNNEKWKNYFLVNSNKHQKQKDKNMKGDMIESKQKCIWYFSSESSRLPEWRLYIVLKGRKRGGRGSFPFGSILHTHSRHCRRCKGRNLLHDVPVCENMKLSEEQNQTISILTRKEWNTWYNWPMVAEVGGMTLFTKKKRASSALRWIRFRMRK